MKNMPTFAMSKGQNDKISKVMAIEKEQKKEKESKDLVVTVRTLLNGYMLEVNGEGFMYFNAQSLMEGFCVHVGMRRLSSMTQEDIKDFLKSVKDGSLVRKLQDEVTQLKAKILELKDEIKKQKKEIDEMNRQFV